MNSQAPTVAKAALQEFQAAASASLKAESGVEALVLRHLIVIAEDELQAVQVHTAWLCQGLHGGSSEDVPSEACMLQGDTSFEAG